MNVHVCRCWISNCWQVKWLAESNIVLVEQLRTTKTFWHFTSKCFPVYTSLCWLLLNAVRPLPLCLWEWKPWSWWIKPPKSVWTDRFICCVVWEDEINSFHARFVLIYKKEKRKKNENTSKKWPQRGPWIFALTFLMSGEGCITAQFNPAVICSYQRMHLQSNAVIVQASSQFRRQWKALKTLFCCR